MVATVPPNHAQNPGHKPVGIFQNQGEFNQFMGSAKKQPLRIGEPADAQPDALKESGKQIQEQLARDIARLQKAARKKLISSPNPSQQERGEVLFGELFDFKPPAKPERDNKSKK